MHDGPMNQRVRIRILQAGALLLAIPIVFMKPEFSGDGSQFLEMAGVFLVLVCILGRMWSILYIGTNKNSELVTTGPYSMTRNPLYFFSMLGAIGIGYFIGSVVLGFVLGLVVYLVLSATARREAAHLETMFGASYREYARTTPVFIPKPALYREAMSVTFSPRALRRTFLDGLLFICVLPAIEFMEFLKEAGHLPILFNLP